MIARTIFVPLLTVAVLVAACAGQVSSPDTTTPGTTTTVEEQSPPMPDETTEPSVPATDAPTTLPSSGSPAVTMAEQAVADLAARLAIDPSEIVVVSWEEMTWPDGSIGCPQPGMRYTQAIVNGSKVVLEVDGVEYSYHQGGRRDLFLCEQPTLDKGAAPPTTSLDL
jgi:hypothetical protein